MKRKTRTNLVLIGVVVVLGIAAVWQVNREVARFEPPLSSLDPANIETVKVGCLHCTQRRFERVNGNWMMREPWSLPADKKMITRLLSIATSPVRSRRPLASLDLKKIGLDPALMSLDLDDMHFDFGTTDAFNGDRYVRIGDTIAIAPDRYSPFLLAAPASELDRHLVVRGTTVSELRIEGIEHPELIAAWSEALASRIIVRDESKKEAGGTEIHLTLADGTKLGYRIVRDGDTLIADRSDPPLRYTLTSEQVATLLAGTAISAP